ncbi:hypothetical protein Ahy_B03g062590 [Arachis hypogaea]|uniref:Aminotransferase-like plant mobile domain-containing protein n=1 Tax=Arachis hypogaea TaxID=3818 RepID=A0A444ZUL3_ARAHY|nr:hypothetical protein Ahy_B03g062590 [Arachis hypogaea]
MPFGECTVTLQDVAFQLGLPVDGEVVSGCLGVYVYRSEYHHHFPHQLRPARHPNHRPVSHSQLDLVRPQIQNQEHHQAHQHEQPQHVEDHESELPLLPQASMSMHHPPSSTEDSALMPRSSRHHLSISQATRVI